MQKTLTASRIQQAIEETTTALQRALRYRADLRDHELVDYYKRHIVKLETMLSEEQS